MQHSHWTNINGTTFRTGFTDTEAGHHMSAQHHNLAEAQESLELTRTHANDARERLGIERTDGPDQPGHYRPIHQTLRGT